MPPAPPAVGVRPLLAIITPLTSILLRSSDGESIARQLLGIEPGSVLAGCSFSASEPAMCWLTDPGSIDAVSTGAARVSTPSPTSTSSSGWLAVISRGSRACFEVDASGVGAVVQLIQASASAVYVAARFSSAADAYGWLAGEAAVALLEVLASTAAPSGPGVVRPLLPAVAEMLSIERAPPVLPPVCDRSGGPADVARTASKRKRPTEFAVCTDSSKAPLTTTTRVPGGYVNARRGDSASTLLSAACRGLPPGRHSFGGRAGFEASSSSRSSALPSPLGGNPLSVRHRPVGGHASSGGSGSKNGAAIGKAERKSTASAKRPRLSEEGGPSAALNPAGVARDGEGVVFTMGTIHEMVRRSVDTWEQQDVEEALRRDAALGAQRRATVKDVDCATPRSPLVVAARKGGDACSASAQGLPVEGVVDAVPAACATGDLLDGRLADGRPATLGPLSRMAREQSWTFLFRQLYERATSTFVSGGPGVGKTSFLRGFVCFLRSRLPAAGAVVVVAPTGSAAKTAKGVTYHSFFGFPKQYKMQVADPVQEAARMLALDRWRPIARRLGKVEVLLLDEVSMVPADNLDVMYELLSQSRGRQAPPFVVYTFGDFLQLSPPFGKLAFTAVCWRSLFGAAFVELTHVHRQGQPDFVAAIRDARFGRCTTAVQKLMDERAVSDEAYVDLECEVLHLMPRHEDVDAHNSSCLSRLCPGTRPADFIAVDGVKVDSNRQNVSHEVDLKSVSAHSRDAALMDCVAPRCVQHCHRARVMLITNHFLSLGLFHGSIGRIVDYDGDEGAPVLRFEDHEVVPGTRVGSLGVRDAGADWIEVLCPAIEFEARIFSRPGVLAVRQQVPFVLGWAITVHRSQSLTLSEAVLDLSEAFGAGMVLAAISRVPDKRRMHVRSFSGSRLLADRAAMQLYHESPRL